MTTIAEELARQKKEFDAERSKTTMTEKLAGWNRLAEQVFNPNKLPPIEFFVDEHQLALADIRRGIKHLEYWGRYIVEIPEAMYVFCGMRGFMMGSLFDKLSLLDDGVYEAEGGLLFDSSFS